MYTPPYPIKSFYKIMAKIQESITEAEKTLDKGQDLFVSYMAIRRMVKMNPADLRIGQPAQSQAMEMQEFGNSIIKVPEKIKEFGHIQSIEQLLCKKCGYVQVKIISFQYL